MSVVGIDFGNSCAVIAAAQKGGVDVLLNEGSSRQTASMVSFGEKERYLGEAAAVQYMRNIKNTVTDMKRLLGHKWNETEIQKEIAKLPYKCVELPNHDVGVQVMYAGEQRTFSVVQVVAMLLQKLKLTAEHALGKPCKDVVISVPGYWTDQQRRAMLNATSVANMNCLRLINDHAATALQYGIYKTNLSETDPIHVLFVDMGQINTSVSVVEFLKGKLKVLSAVFDRNLGGRDFDQLLVQHFANEWKGKYKIDITTNPRALIRTQIACERLKRMLNTNAEAPINIDSIMEDKDVSGMMSKENFEKMCKPLVEKVTKVVKQAIDESGIAMEKLFAVEIVGGASRLTSVKNGLSEFFKKDVSQTLNAEEAVAKGCALQCAMLSPLFKVREFSVTDTTPFPIKVSWKNLGAETAKPEDVLEIYTKNNPIPSQKVMTFTRSEPMELVAEYVNSELIPPGAEVVLGRYTVPKIPLKDNEPAKVRARARLDLHSIFSFEGVQVIENVEEDTPATPTDKKEETKSNEPTPMETEPTTPTSEASPKETKPEEAKTDQANGEKKEEQKKKRVRRIDIQYTEVTSGLTDKQLQELIEEEARMVASDRLAIETAEQKNAVESYVYDMRSKLNESLSSYATSQVREGFSLLLEKTESWLYGDGEDVPKSVYMSKLQELKSMGDPITKRKYEDDNRYEAIMQLRTVIQNFMLFAESTDPKYEHIEQPDRQKVSDECKNIEKWINDEMAKQDKRAKHEDPTLTIADINKKKTELEKLCTPIMNKPKPKPKVEEPKKEEPKKEEAKPAEGEKKEGDAPKPESKPTEDKKPPVDMDLD